MWFFAFTTEYELSKFERVVAEAWKDNLQVSLIFLYHSLMTTIIFSITDLAQVFLEWF
jgi:hypothetical protein